MLRKANGSSCGFGRIRKKRRMTTKQKVLNAVQSLPENASYEDVMERLLFLAKIEKGLKQADAGQTVSHSVVRQKMKRWS